GPPLHPRFRGDRRGAGGGGDEGGRPRLHPEGAVRPALAGAEAGLERCSTASRAAADGGRAVAVPWASGRVGAAEDRGSGGGQRGAAGAERGAAGAKRGTGGGQREVAGACRRTGGGQPGVGGVQLLGCS